MVRKVPLAASLNGMPAGKGSRRKLIRVTGIPGLPVLELSGRQTLNLEIRSGSREELVGHLELGAIPRWRSVDDRGPGKELYWENLRGWVEASHKFRKPR